MFSSDKGALKKKFAPTATKKERGGSANAPHCARSASDPRARPFENKGSMQSVVMGAEYNSLLMIA